MLHPLSFHLYSHLQVPAERLALAHTHLEPPPPPPASTYCATASIVVEAAASSGEDTKLQCCSCTAVLSHQTGCKQASKRNQLPPTGKILVGLYCAHMVLIE